MKRFSGSAAWLLVAVGVTSIGAASCASGQHEASPAARTASSVRPWCGRLHPGRGAIPAKAVHESSPVAIVHDGKKTLAYVADADDATIHVIDVDAKREMTTVALEGAPSQLLVAPDGRVVAALRDKGSLEVLEPTSEGSLEKRCVVESPAEPIALASSPDDTTVYVTTGWGHRVSAYDARTLEPRYDVEVAREPRAIVVSDDGKKAFVSHAVGSKISVVDLATPAHPVHEVAMLAPDETSMRKRVFVRSALQTPKGTIKTMMPQFHETMQKGERRGCQGFALAKSIAPGGRILAPQVLVETGDTEQRASGYGTSNGSPSEISDVAVLDESTDAPFAPSLAIAQDPAQGLGMASATEGSCLLPRAATVDPARHALFVTCLGSDTLVEYDATSAEPSQAIIASWRVGSGPLGVAIDGNRAVVFAQFDRTVHVVDLGAPDTLPHMNGEEDETTTHIALSRHAVDGAQGNVALGRRLFHSTGDARISSDGRACASCHPDGRDDSLTWSTPDGPRNTPALAGRLAGTAPYAWSGSGDSVKGHLTHTFQRLRGAGLRGEELDALVAYVTRMAPPPAKTASEDAKRARGEAIFHSGEAGCSGCHGKGGVAPDGELHDVGSAASADIKKEFDTPSLKFVGGTGPYFHDGRYTTIRELLVKSDGQMGKTAQLSPQDLDALETYVRSL